MVLINRPSVDHTSTSASCSWSSGSSSLPLSILRKNQSRRYWWHGAASMHPGSVNRAVSCHSSRISWHVTNLRCAVWQDAKCPVFFFR